jgi:hypothetical protein
MGILGWLGVSVWEAALCTRAGLAFLLAALFVAWLWMALQLAVSSVAASFMQTLHVWE